MVVHEKYTILMAPPTMPQALGVCTVTGTGEWNMGQSSLVLEFVRFTLNGNLASELPHVLTRSLWMQCLMRVCTDRRL